MALINHVDQVAKNKMGVPGWEPYAWERIGKDGLLVTGGIPRLLKSGPRKGEKTWDGEVNKVVVVEAEVDAEKSRYEEETGKCHKCLGAGEVISGWSKETGRRMLKCPRCLGCGLKP
jgi:hypothetical protein